MNGVLGMAKMLLYSPLSPEQREYTETICSSSEALLSLLNDILDLSKIQQGCMSLEPVSTNLRDFVEDIVALMAANAFYKDLELVFRVDPNAPATVMVDSTRLRQVILNLLGNSIKFTSKGNVFLDIRFVHGQADTSRADLLFSVSDTGIGISKEKLSQIFDRFSQADNSTTRQFGGTGLGLAIAKSLIELMGSHISVESEVGRGSCFEFVLSLPAEPATQVTSHPLKGKRIIVAGASQLTGAVVAELLQSWQASVAVARNSGEVVWPLENAAAQQGEAVVAYRDGFPDEDAFALYCRRCHENRIPVIGIFSNTQDSGWFQEAGYKQMLFLPLRSGSLLDSLCKALRLNTMSVAEALSSLEQAVDSGQLLDCHILVAEDNRVNQRVIEVMLNKLGCKADLARNGKEAINMWQSGSYDVVLMDCQMPEMDGYQASAAIRRAERQSGRSKTPIVALTANAMAGDRETCLVAGMDDHLSKPVSLEALRDALDRCMEYRDEFASR
jgi:two-component system, sensor histidine kinase and response regulator